MSEDDNQNKPKPYLTYKGMGFVPLTAGIPLFVALGIMGGLVLVMVLFIAGLHVFGIILFFVLLGAYFFFRLLCEANNKAPALLKLRIKGLLFSLKHGKIIIVDYGVESNEQRKKFREKFKSVFRT